MLPLLFLRILHVLVRGKRIHVNKNCKLQQFFKQCLDFFHIENRMEKPDFAGMYLSSLVRKLWILSSINKLFYPLILYPIYLTVGKKVKLFVSQIFSSKTKTNLLIFLYN